jgi:threonine dehydratase
MPITKKSIADTATEVGTQKFRPWLIQNVSDTDILVSVDGTAAVTLAAGDSPGILLKASGAVGSILTSEMIGGPKAGKKIYAIHASTGNSKTLVFHQL